jgi:hypothetical protein
MEEVERAVDYLRDAAPKHAKAKAERQYIENFMKSKKALLMKRHADQPLGAQERDALADPEYIELLVAHRVVLEEETLLRGLMDAAQTKIDWWRSVNASNRNIDRAVS